MSNNASIFGNVLFNSTLFTARPDQMYGFENCTNVQIFAKGFPLYVESPYESAFPPPRPHLAPVNYNLSACFDNFRDRITCPE